MKRKIGLATSLLAMTIFAAVSLFMVAPEFIAHAFLDGGAPGLDSSGTSVGEDSKCAGNQERINGKCPCFYVPSRGLDNPPHCDDLFPNGKPDKCDPTTGEVDPSKQGADVAGTCVPPNEFETVETRICLCKPDNS